MYAVEFSSQASQFIKKCESVLRDRLLKKNKQLSHNPFPSDMKRVIGKKDKIYRVRVGQYRIQ